MALEQNENKGVDLLEGLDDFDSKNMTIPGVKDSMETTTEKNKEFKDYIKSFFPENIRDFIIFDDNLLNGDTEITKEKFNVLAKSGGITTIIKIPKDEKIKDIELGGKKLELKKDDGYYSGKYIFTKDNDLITITPYYGGHPIPLKETDSIVSN